MSMADNDQKDNEAALSYLKEYCDPTRSRDFAVLLDGPWGTGKTFFIKNFLSNYPQHLYVSLYGISEVGQIDDEFYRQLHPVLSSQKMRLAGRLIKGLAKGVLKVDLDGDGKSDGSISIGLPDINLKEELTNPEGYLLVFDDLERCSVPVSQILGYINSFVEHDGMKAVIVANEYEILKSKDQRYAEIKEKLVGQTLRVKATVNSAYDDFLKGVSSPGVKAFLNTHKERVIGIHKQSETGNLRLLKQALWDFERVAVHFLEEHWADDEAMRSLASILLALSIEHRAGRLLAQEHMEQLLEGSMLRALQRDREGGGTIVDEIEERYQATRFDNTVLSPNLIVDAVLHGRVMRDEILDSLNKSRYFAKADEVPLWIKAWDYFHFTDEEAAKVALDFNEAFESREFVERGVVYHAFGILLAFCEINLLDMSREDAAAECIKYVDDLVTDNKIFAELDRENFFDFGGTFGSRGFHERDSLEFKSAVGYYEKQADIIVMGKYPEFAQEIMEMLEHGNERFVLDLCLNNAGPSRFYDKPILSAIAPQDFVRRVLKLTSSQQNLAFNVLKDRHKFPSSDQALAQEKLWLIKVRDELESQCNNVGPVSKVRIRYFVDKTLKAVVDRALEVLHDPRG